MKTEQNTTKQIEKIAEEGKPNPIMDGLNEAVLKQKYGELYHISQRLDSDDEHEGRLAGFYFKAPTQASFNRYLKNVSKNMAASTTIFVQDNVIDEQKEILEAESGKYPGLPLSIGQKLLAAIGMGDETNFRRL